MKSKGTAKFQDQYFSTIKSFDIEFTKVHLEYLSDNQGKNCYKI